MVSIIIFILVSLVTARISCPTFFGAHDNSQLVYPTPGFKVDYDETSKEVTLVVNAVYDPFAALVIDFQPYVATRKSLSEFGKCENRDDSTTRKWSWRRDSYSACTDDEDNVSYYPSKGHNWTRTDRDCNMVEYTYKSTISDLMNNCGTTMMGWREVDGKKQFYGNVYVTYVRPDRQYDYECIIRVNDSDNCEIDTVYAEQQITFYLTNEIKTTNVANCSDNGKINVTSEVNCKQNSIDLNIYTNVANPTDRGLLCSLNTTYTGSSDLNFTTSKKECSCEAHCNSSTFCTKSSTNSTCVQQWTLQSTDAYTPGCLNGSKFNLKWNVNNCKDYQAGLTSCPHKPTSTCSAVVTVKEGVTTSYEYGQPMRPFAALLLRQPVNDRFDYSFSNSDLKVWVRVTPLVNTRANVSRIEYCEADNDGINCKNSWTTVKTWSNNQISPNQYVEASTVITDPRNKIFLFRAISDKDDKGAVTLVLDTHNGSNRIAPIPTTYVAVDRTYCDGNYDGDPDDGFSLDGIDVKKIIKLAGAILTTIAVA